MVHFTAVYLLFFALLSFFTAVAGVWALLHLFFLITGKECLIREPESLFSGWMGIQAAEKHLPSVKAYLREMDADDAIAFFLKKSWCLYSHTLIQCTHLTGSPVFLWFLKHERIESTEGKSAIQIRHTLENSWWESKFPRSKEDEPRWRSGLKLTGIHYSFFFFFPSKRLRKEKIRGKKRKNE